MRMLWPTLRWRLDASAPKSTLFFTILMMALSGIFFLLLSSLIVPAYSSGTYQFHRQPRQTFSLPLMVSSAPVDEFHVEFTLFAPPLSPTNFRVIPDNCLESISVNGEPLTSTALPIC